MKLEKKYLIPAITLSIISEAILYLVNPTSFTSELLGINVGISIIGFIIDMILSTAFFYYIIEHSQGLYVNLKENKRINRTYFIIGLAVAIIVEILYAIYFYWLFGILYSVIAGAIAYILVAFAVKLFNKIKK